MTRPDRRYTAYVVFLAVFVVLLVATDGFANLAGEQSGISDNSHLLYYEQPDGELWSVEVDLTTWTAGAWRRLKTAPEPYPGVPITVAAAQSGIVASSHMVYVVFGDGSLWSVEVDLITWTAGAWRKLKSAPEPFPGVPTGLDAVQSGIRDASHMIYVAFEDGSLWSVEVDLVTWTAGAWRKLKDGPTAAVELPEDHQRPDGLQIGVAPNPFAAQTTIEFSMDRASDVRLDVFSPNGQLVRNLLGEELSTGLYRVCWDGLDDSGHSVSPGTYFCRLKAGDQVTSWKVVLAK